MKSNATRMLCGAEELDASEPVCARQTCSTTWLARVFSSCHFSQEDAQCAHIFFRLQRSVIIGRGLGRAPFIGNANTCAAEYDTATLSAPLLCSLLLLGLCSVHGSIENRYFQCKQCLCRGTCVPAKHQHRVRICWFVARLILIFLLRRGVPYAHNAERSDVTLHRTN